MLSFTIYDQGLEEIGDKIASGCTEAEHVLAVQIKKDTDPFVPALTGSLMQRTRIEGQTGLSFGPGSGSYIVYPGPYARYLYYGKVMVDSATGKGPMRIVGKDGTEVIRFRKGAKLKPIDRDLKFNKSMNRHAQSHWFEASKAKNLSKWLRVAKEAATHEFK